MGQPTRKLEVLHNTGFKQICNRVHRPEELGVEGLKDKPKSGRKPGLSEGDLAVIVNVLQNSRSDDFGYHHAKRLSKFPENNKRLELV